MISHNTIRFPISELPSQTITQKRKQWIKNNNQILVAEYHFISINEMVSFIQSLYDIPLDVAVAYTIYCSYFGCMTTKNHWNI